MLQQHLAAACPPHSPPCPCFPPPLPAPCRLSAVAQAGLVATLLPHTRAGCRGQFMSHPAVQRATHRIYGMLSWVGTPLPLPLAPMVAPTPAEECAVAVTFFQGGRAYFGGACQAAPRGMGRQAAACCSCMLPQSHSTPFSPQPHPCTLPPALTPGPLETEPCGQPLHPHPAVGLGLLLPLLFEAVVTARAFAMHQRQRRAAGLPPERGLQVCEGLGGVLRGSPCC